MKKKALALIVSVLVMLAGMAGAQTETDDVSAPRTGRAYCLPGGTEQMVSLYEEPDDGSRALMAYFPGAQVEVLNLTDGMAHVRVGNETAGLEGYMDAEDLLYGPMAQRVVKRVNMLLTVQKEETVYLASDEAAAPWGTVRAGECTPIIGWNREGWFQQEGSGWQNDVLYIGQWDLFGTASDAGFLHLESGSYEGEIGAFDWNVYPPVSGELTHEEAYERALEILLGRTNEANGSVMQLPEHLRTEEGLRSMRADVRLMPYLDGLYWFVMLEEPENTENNVAVVLTPTGGVKEITHTNG